jgi:DNA polymerase III subunit delta
MEAARITLITGTEQFLAERAVANVKRSLRSAGDFDLVVVEISDETRPGDLFAATSATLLGGNRLVIIVGSELLDEKLAAELQEVIAIPDNELWLIIRHQDGRKNRKLVDALKPLCELVAADKVVGKRDVDAFIVAEAARFKRKISPDAIESLRTSLGDDIRLLAAAIDQITAATTGNLTQDMVEEYFDGIAEIRGYHVSDRLWAGDLAQALEKFRWMVLNDGAGANIQVVAAIATDLRSMVRIMGAPGGQSDEEIARSLGWSEKMGWKVRALRSVARGWKPAALAHFANRLADIDAQLKGGAAGIGLDETARTAVVEKFLVDIARK